MGYGSWLDGWLVGYSGKGYIPALFTVRLTRLSYQESTTADYRKLAVKLPPFGWLKSDEKGGFFYSPDRLGKWRFCSKFTYRYIIATFFFFPFFPKASIGFSRPLQYASLL